MEETGMFQYVIFDMDGVLIDSEPMHARAGVNVAARYGVGIDISYCYRFIGSTTRFMMQTMIRDFGLKVSEEELLLATEQEKERLTREEGYTQVPGVCEFVNDLYENGIRLAVASSSNPDEIEKAVMVLGIRSYFQCLVSGCNVPHPKPEPDVFLKAAEELGAKPEECLVIEDSSNGLLAAKRAGMTAIGFANPNSGKQDLSDAYMVIEGFEEIDYSFALRVHSHAHGIPCLIAETERLLIQEMGEEDASELIRIYQDKEIAAYMDRLSNSIEEEKEKLKAYAAQIYRFYGYGIWGIYKKEDHRLIGRCGIECKQIDGAAEYEISWMIAVKEQRKGYALEAVYAVLSLAKKLGIRRLVAVIDKRNIPSCCFAQKLGFLEEKECIQNGRECLVFAIEIVV